MKDLERLMADWRASMKSRAKVDDDALAELETHLREDMDRFLKDGLDQTEAFNRALANLGPPAEIASEFKHADRTVWWPVKVAIALEGVAALIMVVFMTARFRGGALNILLGAHVFTVTMGYLATFLIGGLGICFVCQRSFSEFSERGLQSLKDASFRFAVAAAALTAVGIALGMLWTKASWGRYWAWDIKETSGLAVLSWLIAFSAAHRWKSVTSRGLLLAGLAGNVIVTFAWFGPPLVDTELHAYGTLRFILIAVAISHLAILLVGLAPAGWLGKARESHSR